MMDKVVVVGLSMAVLGGQSQTSAAQETATDVYSAAVAFNASEQPTNSTSRHRHEMPSVLVAAGSAAPQLYAYHDAIKVAADELPMCNGTQRADLEWLLFELHLALPTNIGIEIDVDRRENGDVIVEWVERDRRLAFLVSRDPETASWALFAGGVLRSGHLRDASVDGLVLAMSG